MNHTCSHAPSRTIQKDAVVFVVCRKGSGHNIVSQFSVLAQDINLNVLEIGNKHGLPVICLHGLRDTAHALIPVFTQSWQDPPYRILLPELRGHGTSDESSAYTMPNFLMDLSAVIDHIDADQVALIGHSLGGHVVTQFAALWPERVRALVIIEGLGPPQSSHQRDERDEMQAYRHMIERRLKKRSSQPMASLKEALCRLQKNNPRLNSVEAERLVAHLTRRAPNGQGVTWAFDSTASSVFIGSSTETNQKYWRQIQAPVCLISGTRSFEYWRQQMSADRDTGKFAQGELEHRAQQFKQHEHHRFEHSGHMVHYDEPLQLGRVCRAFLEKHYV